MNAKAERLLRQQYLHAPSGRVLSESEEETAARALLAEVHRGVRDVLKRIDASLERRLIRIEVLIEFSQARCREPRT
jgi:hypothetical protein